MAVFYATIMLMIYILIAGLGLALGSFVNALVWRVHEQMGSRKKADDPHLSVLRGRSMCPDCRHTLNMADLIPLLSWLMLKGKCRYCQKPVSAQYPVVEVMTAALFITSYHIWPYGFSAHGIFFFGTWLITLTGLVALAVYDVRWMLLPNRIVYPLTVLWAALIAIRAVFFEGGMGLVIGSVIGLIICGGLFWVLFQLSDGEWIGGGDVKLGFLLGLIAGNAMPAFLIIFLASLLGTLWVLPLLVNKKLAIKAQIPFGPFLIVATIIVFLLGDRLIGQFADYFLLV